LFRAYVWERAALSEGLAPVFLRLRDFALAQTKLRYTPIEFKKLIYIFLFRCSALMFGSARAYIL
jgi:hypothetical protein